MKNSNRQRWRGHTPLLAAGCASAILILTPDNTEQKLSIHPWYGVISPANRTQVTAPENTRAKIISVPYILPVFWIITLAEINPYLPLTAEIATYTFIFILLLLPLWYRKATMGSRSKRTTIHRLFARWKRTLHYEKFSH